MRFTLLPAVMLMLSAPCSVRAWAMPEAEIQAMIYTALKNEGGEVVVTGDHLITGGLRVPSGQRLRIRGNQAEKSVLRLSPAARATAAGETAAGATRLPVRESRGIVPGMRLRIAFKRAKARVKHDAVVKAVQEDILLLEAPLEQPVTESTLIQATNGPTLITIEGPVRELLLEDLTFDGGLLAQDSPLSTGGLGGVMMLARAARGQALGGGKLRISRCTFQNFHGSGIHLFAQPGVEIDHCTFRDVFRPAIILGKTARAGITNSNFVRCAVGMDLGNTQECIVAGNDFTDCRAGINIWCGGGPGFGSGNILFQNTLLRTGSDAIRINSGCHATMLLRNHISDSRLNGIVLLGQGHVVKKNQIFRSGGGNIVVEEGKHEIDAVP